MKFKFFVKVIKIIKLIKIIKIIKNIYEKNIIKYMYFQ